MGVYDLTTLAACKLWLGSTNDNSDAAISQQITRVSSMIMSWLNGPGFVKASRNEYYNGKNTRAIILRNWPVISISALSINAAVIPVNPTPSIGSGYFLEPWDGDVPAGLQALYLNGYGFTKGAQNINVQYVSGYVQTEATVVPATPFQYTPLAPLGLCVADAGVTYANGTALVAVASAPTVGQYIAPTPLAATSPLAYYTFALADVAKAVLVSYSYVPYAVMQAATDLVGERIEYKGRIGLKSKSLGGQETMSYDINKLPDWVKTALQPFMNVVPM